MQSADDGKRPYPKSQQKGQSDRQLDQSNQVSEKDGVRQHDVFEHRPVKTDRAVLNETLQILLKAAVRESRAEDLVLSEKQEENGRSHAGDRNGFA